MRKLLIRISLILLFSWKIVIGQTIYQTDFDYYWETINNSFAYFEKRQTNWEKVKTIYQPIADTITNRNDFIHLLESINHELYNGHVFLNTNLNSSNRLIPTGSDLKVSWINNHFLISELRQGYNAEICGLTTGMEIIKFNGLPIREAIKKFIPKSVSKADKEMYEYAGNMLLAGSHDTKREITVFYKGKEQIFYPDQIPNKTGNHFESLIETKILNDNIGYLKINNSLGHADLAKWFDLALDSLANTNGLILDLRETPGGGNTNQARAILGRFIENESAYQKHIYIKEEKETGIKRSALEIVSPRHSIYKKPVIVLVGYWTASMGEGIAIGFDAMKRAKIVGTKMAGLLGEIYTFETPELKIPFSFPSVQLQHVNGQPREDFLPTVMLNDQHQLIKIAKDLLKKEIEAAD